MKPIQPSETATVPDLAVPPEVQAEFDAQLDAMAAELEAALTKHFAAELGASGSAPSRSASTTSQCSACEHFHRHRTDATSCNAFPDWIPPDLVLNRADHSQPYPGDHGVRFSPRPSGDHGHSPTSRTAAYLGGARSDG